MRRERASDPYAVDSCYGDRRLTGFGRYFFVSNLSGACTFRHFFYQLVGILGFSKLLKRRIGMKTLPILLGFLLAEMSDEIDECVGPAGSSLVPSADDIQTMFCL